jgi:Protein of unknown function (DUF2442)
MRMTLPDESGPHGATVLPRIAAQPRVAAVRYDRRGRRILVLLTNGLELGVPVRLAQRLAGESASDLEYVEISPTGLALRWPRLNADLYLPALLSGLFGSRRQRWLAFWAGWKDVSSLNQ